MEHISTAKVLHMFKPGIVSWMLREMWQGRHWLLFESELTKNTRRASSEVSVVGILDNMTVKLSLKSSVTQRRHMASEIMVNTGSGEGLLPDGTNPTWTNVD